MMATQSTQVAFVERYGTAIVLDLLALDELICQGSRYLPGRRSRSRSRSTP